MDLKLVVAVAAFGISLLSLYVSYRTSEFNKRVKIAEIRSNLLSQLASQMGSLDRIADALSAVRSFAKERSNFDLYEKAGPEPVKVLKAKATKLYDLVEKSPNTLGIYEKVGHDIAEIKDKAEKLSSFADTFHGDIAAKRAEATTPKS